MHLEAPVKRNPGIGLTPLIDVVFILLVFFMLATRFSEWQQAPLQVRAAGAAGAEESVARLHLTGADHLQVDGREMTVAELPAWLGRHRDSRLVVTTESEVTLQTLVRVTDIIQASGHPSVDLALLDGGE
jgi:biopolymer transport protein ExbD